MPTNQQILIAYVTPGAISLVLALLAWRPWSSAAPRGHWAVPVSIAIGVATTVIGFANQHKPPGWPPQLAEDWLFWGAIAVLLVGLLDALVPLWPELRSILAIILGAALCYLVIRRVADQWPPHRILTCIGGAAMAIALASLVIERSSERQPGWIVPLVLLICAAALTPWPLFRGSADFTFRAAALPTVLLPIVPIAWW